MNPDTLKKASRANGEPDWLTDLRVRWFEAYLDKGFPGPFEEEWRGTDLGSLGIRGLPFRLQGGGKAAQPLVQLLEQEGGGSKDVPVPLFSRLLDAVVTHREALRPYLFKAYETKTAPALVALNAGLVQDGAFLHIPRGFEEARPYRVRVSPGQQDGMLSPRNVVAVEEAGRATFIEDYDAPGRIASPVFANSVTEVHVGRGASLDILTLIRFDDAVSCCHRAVARIAEGGRLRWYLGTVGGGLVRVDVETYLEGPGAESYIVGIGIGDGNRHIDHRTVQDHLTGDTRSRIHFGTLLKGESKSIYRGMIRMEEGAVRSDAYQKNDNLILESGPEARAIPMLEILTDDVKCSHGSTVGRINRDEIFYMTSRGIPEARARDLIADGFIRRQLQNAGDWNPLTEELHGILRGHALGLEGNGSSN